MPRLTVRQRLTWSAHLWKALTRQHHLELRSRFRPLIPQDGVVLDVGAHGGQFTKLFSAMAPKGHVHAFEPGSYALSILKTVKSFKRLSNVTVHDCGLGDSSQIGVLNVPIKESGSVGSGLSFVGDSPPRERASVTEDIAIRRLDEVVAECGIPQVDFIKCDIEGSEMRMLVGARETLSRFSPAIYIELANDNLARHGDNIEALTGFLGDLGYRPVGGSCALEVNQLFTRSAS
ncbi:MAG: FkbM family methyltransferase [Alphaproteobacteria bacterium]|nr:FkbM family methyltransferase [Alphaproteobacteria bacterium]